MLLRFTVLMIFAVGISAIATAADFTSDDDSATLDRASDKLISVYNDRNTGYSDLELVVDGQGVPQGIKWVPHEKFVAAEKSFTLAQLAAGAVLEEQQGIKALTLTGRLDLAAAQGRWALKYIANGLSGEYKSCDMVVKRTPQGDWAVMNATTGAIVQKAKIITWSLGIKTIEGICP